MSQLQGLLRDLLLASSIWEQSPGASGLKLRTSASDSVEVWGDDEDADDLEVPLPLKRDVEQLWREFQTFDARISGFRCVRVAELSFGCRIAPTLGASTVGSASALARVGGKNAMKLNSWEVPDDESAERVEDGGVVEWNGREWQMLLLPPVGMLALRLVEGGNNSPLWRRCSLAGAHNAAPAELNKRREVTRTALEERSLTQHFYVSKDIELRMPGEQAASSFALDAEGEGFVRLYPSPSGLPLSSRFSWTPPSAQDSTGEQNAPSWWHSLRDELKDEISDVNFALSFARVPALQKEKLIWPWSEKELEEVRRVLSWALLAQGELWKQSSACWHLTVWFDQHDAGHRDRLEFGTSNIPLGLPPAAWSAASTSLRC